ncbi:GTPase-activating protein CdGAPr [Gryllus bimaculatus]|nr:GTPase-activating protein CdGAPr [Gryllus bimaculatus]
MNNRCPTLGARLHVPRATAGRLRPADPSPSRQPLPRLVLACTESHRRRLPAAMHPMDVSRPPRRLLKRSKPASKPAPRRPALAPTQHSRSTAASSLSDDVFVAVDPADWSGRPHSCAHSASFDVNAIFDDGTSVPVAPPRFNKMKRLKLSSCGSKSAIDTCGTEPAPANRLLLSTGDPPTRERKARSFFSDRKSFSTSAALSTSLQNLNLCSVDSSTSSDATQQRADTSVDEGAMCESGSDSSLLEVNVPTVKPVSSFVFPSNVENNLRPPSPKLRCISSVEDFTSSMCDSLLLERPRKGSGSSDIAAWKRDLQRSPFFSQDDDYMPAEEWFSSTDGKGRVYYFEENSNVSTWTLPNIVVANEEEASGELQLESSNLPLRNQDGEKKSRVGKARSLFLSDPKHKETTSKSSSIPRNWLQLYGLDKDVLKYGNMNRTKITENGKKMSKRWASAYVVLTEDAICFYKDLKNSQHSVGLQPELSMQLSGARVEPGEKLSSRKHVFLITSGSLQLLCECDSAEGAAQWRSAITDAIVRLAKPVVTPPAKISQDKPKTASIGRSKSLQVKNREGAFDDATSTEEQQMKIRDRLKKFFNRRPTREILASKGIYKDEPVFDSHLEKVCPSRPPFIPDFVRLCVTAIESKEENMKTDGLYRASGNLSHVQKIRLQVDQNNLCVLEAEEDVHVLTGALKLFFRELKEPLIPYELFNEAIDAGGMNGSKKDKVKVTKYEEFNRMHVPNLAIVFGPTLMWREKEYHQNMAIEYMQQNLVIEFFLQQFDEIFSEWTCELYMNGAASPTTLQRLYVFQTTLPNVTMPERNVLPAKK